MHKTRAVSGWRYGAGFVLTALIAGGAWGQDYPLRPLRLVVCFPAGGAADIMGRMTAQQLAGFLNVQVVVDNRGGAGGVIATEIVAHANPDGYTLLFTSIPHVINPHMYKSVGYDAVRDFTPIVQFATAPLMLAVHPSLPAKSVGELVAMAKSRPGMINYASGGSAGYFAGELFKSMAGVDLTHIQYRGTGPALVDLLSGQVTVTIGSAVPLIPHVKAGKLRGLAVTSAKRSQAVPDLPPVADAVPGYDVTNWFGVLAPKGTVSAIVMRLNGGLNKALATRELQDRLLAQGADAVGGTPAEFGTAVSKDFVKWAQVVKNAVAPMQ